RTVKPRLIVETGHIDYQGIALPAAHRPAHETVGRRRLYLVEINDPAGARILVGDDDLVVALNDLEGKGHVSSARHTRQIALGFRIEGLKPDSIGVYTHQPLLKIVFLLCQRLRLIWDLVALYHA